MTKEICDIIKAFDAANREGRQAALATVVHVEGSSYRMPGARMLVEDNGRITGAISGGCLEGDALRKALQAIRLGQNKLVTYNTLHEDDVEFGIQLGCNGVVHILFEPIDPSIADNPIEMLKKCSVKRSAAVLVTLFSYKDISRPQPGTCLMLNDQVTENTLKDTMVGSAVHEDAVKVLAASASALKEYDAYGLTAFFDLVQPPVSLVIFGAGNDVMPLVNMATVLGWQITIIDGRASHATVKRFPGVHKLIVAKPADAINQVTPDERTVFVLMTHNYNYDLAVMDLLLQLNCRYIGTLGPKRRLLRMMDDLHEQGVVVTPEQLSRVYGPIGLDIGAEGPEEIALSILAEIKAVMAGHQGGFLRYSQKPIHSRPEQIADKDADILNRV